MKPKKGKLLLSIGIIFKNEIRCLERCLKSLQPIRDAIRCELVMADTGAEDGSREIAEKYADILFDFPWINDFAAARNAVMDRCSGKWYLSIDCDEWFDENVSALIGFLKNTSRKENYAALTIRNYDSYDYQSTYADFIASRLVRMSTGQRYDGAIHEKWVLKGSTSVFFLENLLLHHDGYVLLNSGQGEEKRNRNLTLLRAEMEENPDDLMLLMQYIESGRSEPDYMDKIYRAKQLIEEKAPKWETIGPPLMRYIVNAAYDEKLPEFEEWAEEAATLFPSSIFIRTDVNYLSFCNSFSKKDWEKAIVYGEAYLKAVSKSNKRDFSALYSQMFSVLKSATPLWEQHVKIALSIVYLDSGKPEHVFRLLKGLKYEYLEAPQVENLAKVAAKIHTYTFEDTAGFMKQVWDGLTAPKPSSEKAKNRKNCFLNTVAPLFYARYRSEEERREGFCRHAYTMFLPLEDRLEYGRAAAILETDDPALLTQKLETVEKLEDLPIAAFAHAVACGAAFPLPGKPMRMEQMETLVHRMSEDTAGRLIGPEENLTALALKIARRDFGASSQSAAWARTVAMAAVRVFPWAAAEDAEKGVRLARAFAKIEEAFLARYYTPEMLEPQNICLLPPMHGFAWHCIRAFRAMDGNDLAGYTAELRAGLEVSAEMKPVVVFLKDQIPEVEQLEVSAELRALADQIRAILSNYGPDDPAVIALKQSEAYQKVAHLIEGATVPVQGGRVQ